MIAERADRIVARVRLIGSMEAWTAAGETILPAERLGCAMLAILALAMPRPVSRAWLCELLSNRRGADIDRGSFRREIRLLTQALLPAGAGVLLATRDTLALRPGTILTDVQQVQCASVARPEALSLLDGELLAELDGITPAFDAWLAQQRESLRDAALGIANAALSAAKTPRTTVVAARRLLFVDPVFEGGWRALMRAHAALGDRDMAVRRFEQCRATLAARLDTEPSAETMALLAATRRSAARDRTSPAPALTTAARQELSWPRVGIPPMRYIGPGPIKLASGDDLSDHIAAALKEFLNFVVVGPDELSHASPERGDDAEILRVMEIDYVVDGTVQCDGKRVRISLRLYEPRDDNRIIWAERFDRAVNEVPSTGRRQVAAEAVARIEPELRLSEARRAIGSRSLATRQCMS